VLFVTNYAPPFRVPSFAALHAAEDVRYALVGGSVRHGGGTGESARALPFPARVIAQRTVARLAASGRFRAVVCGLSGRLAPLAAYAGARAAGVPFVLWATLWRHPRTPAHRLGWPLVRHLYRHADAIVTYGPHVSAMVRRQHPRGPVFEAPQAVDTAFWSAPAAHPRRLAPFQVAFAGRLEAEKGLDMLLAAWRELADDGRAALAVCGDGPLKAAARAAGAQVLGALDPSALRDVYAGSDVVVVPSLPTRAFLEPWGLVCNEAFHQGTPVIASDAVGAAAGGLVRDGETGLVVPAGDVAALAGALARLRDDPALRARLAAAARRDVAAYTPEAWAAGVSRALAAAARTGRSRRPPPSATGVSRVGLA
jgi:glycosyltransferase involved in cell wall biosynthesis